MCKRSMVNSKNIFSCTLSFGEIADLLRMANLPGADGILHQYSQTIDPLESTEINATLKRVLKTKM